MQTIYANGIEIAYRIAGSGPALVLCHGGETDSRNFFNFEPLLAQKFTVISYDQRDSGQTKSGDEPYSLADLGRDVGALIEALGLARAHVFGTSWGGVIAQHAALECPDKIDRLVLCGTWPGGEMHVSDELWRLASSDKTPSEWRAYRAMFFSPEFARRQPEDVERLLAAVFSERTPEERARRGRLAFAHDARDRLPTVTRPTLVVAGAEDQIVATRFSAQLANLIPAAQLRLVPGVGHSATLEAPELMAGIVEEFINA